MARTNISGFKSSVFVRDVDAHFDRPRGLIQHWINECDSSVEDFAGIGFRRELDFLSVTQPREVRFVGIHLNP